KSTLAALLEAATGFALLSSDVVRRRSAGIAATTVAPYGAGLYTPRAREATYAVLCAEVDAQLAAGRAVIVDATWMRRADRNRLAAAARAYRCPLVFVECRADEAAIRKRLHARALGPSLSDARWDTYVEQRQAWPWVHGHSPAADISSDTVGFTRGS
ncbi:MAG: AAA family ATPase, partial [Steroidobacteraceae bacterium]